MLTLDSAVQLEGGAEAGKKEMRFDLASDEHEDLLPLNEDESGNADSVTPEAEYLMETKDYIRRCCEIAKDAALALDHAHQKGVTHRDIKPENLMLDRQGGVHIIDFGVARFRDDVSLSSTGALVGTPMYMSPEHIAGRVNIDHRSDIYSLGIVLYELLTLRAPHSAPTREGILRQIVNKAMPPVGWQNPGVSRELEAVVHKALARDPDERYQTAEGFAGDLQRFLRGETVTARPYRYKLDRREITNERPTLVTVASSLLAALSAFSIVLMLGIIRTYSTSKSIHFINLAILFLGIFVFLLPSVAVGIALANRFCIWLTRITCMFILLITVRAFFVLGSHDGLTGDLLIWACWMIYVVFIFVSLSLPNTIRWIRNAALTRSDHRRLIRAWRRA